MNEKLLSRKQTVLNIVANSFAYFVGLLISFLLTPFLVSKLGKEIYSFYPITNTIANYATIATAALSTVATRFIVFNIAKNDNDKEAKRYFNASLNCEVALTTALLFIFVFIVIFCDKLFNVPVEAIPSVRFLFAFMLSSVLVNIFSSVFGVATFAKNRIDLRSYRELGNSILRLVLSILAYTLLPTSIAYIGIVALIVAVFSFVIQIIYTKKLLPGFIFNKEKADKSHYKSLISSSIWTIVTSLGNLLLCGSSVMLANVFYNESVSGMYSIAYTLPGLLGGVIYLITSVFYPQITYAIASGDETKTISIIEKVEKVSCALTICIVSVFLGLSKQFYSIWVPSEDSQSLFYLTAAAIIPYIWSSAFYVLTNVFVAQNKVKVPALITIGFGVFNVLCCFIASVIKLDSISIFLITGVLSAGPYCIGYPIYLHKNMKIKYRVLFTPLFKCLLFGFVVFCFTYASTFIFNINNWASFILFGLVFGLLSLLFVFPLIDYSLFKSFLSFLYKRFLKRAKKGN